jgi:purine-binding chemotaxis protein CheW
MKQEHSMQFVVFRAGREEFCIPISTVREIIKTSPVTSIPNAPPSIKGIINVRGEVVTTIDIKTHLEIKDKSHEPKHIIVIKQADGLFGLIVDEVIEIIRPKNDSMQQPPFIMMRDHPEHISGVIFHEGRLIVLLDITKIMACQEFTSAFCANIAIRKSMLASLEENL